MFNRLLLTDLVLPPHIIGLPNVRGHCFLTTVLVMLMRSHSFVRCLFRVNQEVTSDVNSGVELNPLNRDVLYSFGEVPFLWTRAFFRFFRLYLKVSRSGRLDLLNLPLGLWPHYGSGDATKVKPDVDLSLDNLMMLICRLLGNFVRADYLSPGGKEEVFYSDLMLQLRRESSEFVLTAHVLLSVSFVCADCESQFDNHPVALPYVFLRDFLGSGVSGFCDFIADFVHLLPQQLITCIGSFGGKICNSDRLSFSSHEIVSIPSLLVFRFPDLGSSGISGQMTPDELTITWSSEILHYRRIAYSCDYRVYDGGVDSESFRFPTSSEAFLGWHSIAHVLTTRGWLEYNNGREGLPSPALLGGHTSYSLVFYDMDNSFVPEPSICFEEK
ncbi:uncharacterized protein LOC128395086 [Panonychus citri]|uniref:uncharacterized protein LOC128395086 n=1 Tax=Panonychus citri TaxID=50023 RepID=UPI00230820D2|nr:uncharacterized protein LOC128395086 [Panonychus citri]